MGVLVWLGLVLINALVIDKSQASWQDTVSADTRVITDQYSETLNTHGQLVVKTNQLSGVIDKDIQPEQVFKLVETLFPQDPEFNVVGFGRETNGSFDVSVSAPTFLKFSKIARRFSQYDQISNVEVLNVSRDSKTNLVTGTVNFFFIQITPTPTSAATAVTTN
jgi:hypothetical protein